VPLHPGDRFEVPITREAWESGHIPLPGRLRHLVAPTGEPTPVTCCGDSGRSLAAVWDGERGLLELANAGDLFRMERESGRLALLIEAAIPPLMRVGLVERGRVDGAVEVREREIGTVPVRFDPADAEILAAFADGVSAPLPAYELNRWATNIALTPGFEELVSLPFLRDVIPYEHQVAAVKTVLNRMRGRALLADEVGLGKTVEAGIVLSELWRRRLVRRVLVLVPPGLVTQWQEELRRKFGLDFVTHDAEPFRQAGPEAWKRFERVVASFHTAKRPEHAAVIQEIPYDLMIVDEAHHLRNARTVLWQFVNRLARTYLLLLTATPVQNDLEELFNLVTLLQPGQLKTVRAFRREHVARGDKRQPRDPIRTGPMIGTRGSRSRLQRARTISPRSVTSTRPVCFAFSSTFGFHTTRPGSVPPRIESRTCSSVPTFRKPRSTPGGTETTSHGPRTTSFSSSSPQYTAHFPVIGINTSIVGCVWDAAPRPGAALMKLTWKSFASVITGFIVGSSITPWPIML
jgi:hypothetical protein